MPADSERKKLLNLGCGNRYHPAWLNIDFSSRATQVKTHDLLSGIPCADSSLDVVYHSHLLEHLPKKEAPRFIKDCYRVLKKDGIIRVAVPDLEIIAKNYLNFMRLALTGDKTAESNYDWTLLEMYDQVVRDRGGGEMKMYYKQKNMTNRDFVKTRMGYFFDIMTSAKPLYLKGRGIGLWSLKNLFQSALIYLPGEKHRRLGRFRMSGEVHQWMYDRFSLRRLLENAGFGKIIQRSASESYVENWTKYNLDSEPDGSVYKPDSIFMEGKK